jgi:UDPglucose 6-dehydrogenase
VECVNDEQKRVLFQKVAAALGDGLPDAIVAVWGLAFKPNTDDMREAPSLTLIDELLARGLTAVVHDPAAMHEAKRRLGDRVTYASGAYEALDGADALVVVTDWNEYRHPDFRRIKQALRRPIIIDGRNLYAPHRMAEFGFTYISIGRAPVL